MEKNWLLKNLPKSTSEFQELPIKSDKTTAQEEKTVNSTISSKKEDHLLPPTQSTPPIDLFNLKVIKNHLVLLTFNNKKFQLMNVKTVTLLLVFLGIRLKFFNVYKFLFCVYIYLTSRIYKNFISNL